MDEYAKDYGQQNQVAVPLMDTSLGPPAASDG